MVVQLTCCFRFIDLVAPRPLLMIMAEKAVTAWMTHEALERAGSPERLHTIAGATHVDVYDRDAVVNAAVEQLAGLFAKALGSA